MKKIILLLLAYFPVLSQDYKVPPDVIRSLIDADPQPTISLTKEGDLGLVLFRDGYQSIDELAKDELRIAGTRLDPVRYTSSRMTYYKSFSLIDIKSGDNISVDFPLNGKFSFFRWSPNEEKIAYTNTTDKGVELWVLDIKSKTSQKVSDRYINDILNSPFQWYNSNDEILVSLRSNIKEPNISSVPTGPIIQETTDQNAPSRTYQDLIKNKNDEIHFEHYASVELHKMSLNGSSEIIKKGMIKDYDLSPDQNYLLTKTINKPFSYLVPYYRFPYTVSTKNLDNNSTEIIANIPIDEVRPKGFDATREGIRSVSWRNDLGSELYWVEANDGGDPKVKTEHRDIVYTLSSPFKTQKEELVRTKLRFRNIIWGMGDEAIMGERLWKNRNEITSLLDTDSRSVKKVLFDRQYDDIYSDPGSPVLSPNIFNRNVVEIKKNSFYMIGQGGSPEGYRPFLSHLNLNTLESKILFRSEAPYYERPIKLTGSDSKNLITSRESKSDNPNYFIRNLNSKNIKQITYFENPYKKLEQLKKEVINYKRDDGINLSSVVYTLESYDPAKEGRLPVLIWAYPREYTSKKVASQVRTSPYRFTRISYGSPIFWALRGYAVMASTEMPIVGFDGDQPNDSFRDQLVMNAKAAIDKISDMGIGDRDRVGVGGHSYGAFMTANLLAHSDLFAAGIARSGAYNRTLTPFGFQREERTYWEAPELYNYMSPFMHADKVNEPLLLIHGEEDNNSGTFPVQSIRFFNAIKGHGGTSKLVMLPKESHGYRAKESILHMLYEMDFWLERYVKNKNVKPDNVKLKIN
ncbi:MAG: prolyl oligopeptidase family serine peptidase [Cytophagales bacterium]|nr:prolyl oligopeptidase family serine peptidase [Cytophagales bacterium]